MDTGQLTRLLGDWSALSRRLADSLADAVIDLIEQLEQRLA